VLAAAGAAALAGLAALVLLRPHQIDTRGEANSPHA